MKFSVLTWRKIGWLVLLWLLALTGLLLSGQDASAQGPTVDLDLGEEDFRVIGPSALSYLGEVASGDINGDGIDDLIIGASGLNSNAGAAYVIWGTGSGLSGSLDLGASPADLSVYSPGAGYSLGRFVARGDINDDGISDLLLGADGANEDGYTQNGAVYVIHGSDSFASPASIDLSTTAADLEIYGPLPVVT
jgi:hypothetical protein